MSDLDLFSLDAFPQAAVLVRQGLVAAVNPLARHYLPQLEPGAPLPAFLSPLSQDTRAGQGTFSAGLTNYAFRLTDTPEGRLILFHPAAQAALTDTQLDGVLRQMRTFLSEFLMESEGCPPESRPAFRKSFHRMFRLVENLDFMRLAGSPEGAAFHPVTMDLAGLCRQVSEQAATLLRERDVRLEYQSDLSSLLIPGDPQLLQRLLLELIANSAQAIGKGTIHIRLRTQGGRAVLVLSDSGAAPSQRQMAAMLQQDSDQQLPLVGSGAGLGLSVARHIVSLHRGTLLVEWGQGAPTVILSVPTGPLEPRATVNTPAIHRDGGMSPLLVALSDVLPVSVFAEEDLV